MVVVVGLRLVIRACASLRRRCLLVVCHFGAEEKKRVQRWPVDQAAEILKRGVEPAVGDDAIGRVHLGEFERHRQRRVREGVELASASMGNRNAAQIPRRVCRRMSELAVPLIEHGAELHPGVDPPTVHR